ncbi:GNAT family N-acetyltransferase [Clostridium sp. DJ247]|uniref:GNAT family N-acetyltransferase n=1 Tax=Clostridium sp. DJ247 TaxID=2726188 RepID=UPI001628671E|nr:GNAT family N-acetyltransferase [Clostridium sp. DJ247]MBC2580616.1 GNAT family N-acetyltransferase [Clostridium sp. DJ247]
MIDIEITFNDIRVTNIEKKDLPQIHTWMKLENQFIDKENNLKNLNERFLESYISECEFFLKINKANTLIGIIKGRLEFKSLNEMWIWFFYLNDEYHSTGLNYDIINKLMNYFSEEYDVSIFFTRLLNNDCENVNFWKNTGFHIVRMVKSFYDIGGKYMDMLIMKKE